MSVTSMGTASARVQPLSDIRLTYTMESVYQLNEHARLLLSLSHTSHGEEPFHLYKRKHLRRQRSQKDLFAIAHYAISEFLIERTWWV